MAGWWEAGCRRRFYIRAYSEQARRTPKRRHRPASGRGLRSSRLRGLTQPALPFSHDHGGNADAQEIKTDHRGHKDQHGGRVRRRGDNGSDHRNDEYRIQKVLHQELRRDDAEQREKENQHGHLEHDPEAHEDQENHVEVFIDADHWHDGAGLDAMHEGNGHALESDEEMQDARKGHEIAERDAQQEEGDRREQKAGYGAALVFIKGRRHEEPNLVKDVRRREHNADVNAKRQQQVQEAGGMRINQLWVKMGIGKRPGHGFGDELNEITREIKTHERADDDRDQGIDNALPQLGQMLEKGHRAAGLFLAGDDSGIGIRPGAGHVLSR